MPADLPDRPGLSRRQVLGRSAAAAGIVWVAPLVLSAPAAAAGSVCDTGVNLVVNGDASAGLAGWAPVVGGGLIVANVGPTPPAFEAGGSNTQYASQQFNDIGTGCGGSTATLSGLLRGEHTGIGTSVVVTWYSGTGGTGTALGTLTISRTPTSFATVTANGTVPGGTQSFGVRLIAHGHPAQTRGALDDISLIIT